MFPFFFDSTMILLLPAMALALYAQARVKSAYKKYSQVGSAAGITGAETARRLLRENGIVDVAVEETGGKLSDHYDPRARVVRLSSGIFHGRHLAGLAVAAHEVGHAIQHASGYFALNLRHTFLPVANIGSWAAFPLFFIGFFFQSPQMVDIGIVLYAVVVGFQLITLPVEFNASSRAMAQLVDGRYLQASEAAHAKKVLNAAALTYVAATATAVMQLVRLVILRQGMRD
ncbi:MAG TPA: zinc metallopeptidase [Candidatus Latescibacteria bacterium]|nr:zinc metallopeptidase [Candidatus Latescibacterota bacterium]HJP33369.1 zinc metallopeptidase [Candidatus Latescibacterota bacterium]